MTGSLSVTNCGVTVEEPWGTERGLIGRVHWAWLDLPAGSATAPS